MALVREVTGDQSSAEVDQLRRTVNALLVALQQVGDNVAAGDTAEDALQALAEGLAVGSDSDPEGTLVSGSASGAELVGVRPYAKHPRRPGHETLAKAMTTDDY
jgi:uncharacterized protein YgbK (DUF1537 family)